MNKPNAPALNRRTVFAGAGAAGALAAAATVLPGAPGAAPTTLAAGTQPAPAGGYRLTEHIRQYYATART
ncbi:MAG: formate dehydrogenase [Rubrivivax sp.]|jgi:hypothetical protein|nr:formate dehydrogenase [Rubrivivax sp.]